MSTGMILIDLQKAFDTIDHEVFLEKMKYSILALLTRSFSGSNHT